MSLNLSISSVGIMGLGAFGRLIAHHLEPHFQVVAHDPAISAESSPQLSCRTTTGSIAEICQCDLIILAVPVSEIATAIQSLKPHLRPGSTVVDVGSVKPGSVSWPRGCRVWQRAFYLVRGILRG